jgi:succinate dehydrogenase/fumarate reductase cytochrome b subunit
MEEKRNMIEWVNAKLGVAILVAIVLIIAIAVFFHINSM